MTLTAHVRTTKAACLRVGVFRAVTVSKTVCYCSTTIHKEYQGHGVHGSNLGIALTVLQNSEASVDSMILRLRSFSVDFSSLSCNPTSYSMIIPSSYSTLY